MKLIIQLFFAGAALVLMTCSPKISNPEISGLWKDRNTEEFSECYLSFHEKEDSVYMTHFLKFNGKPFFETGVGIRRGNKIIYDVDVVHDGPNWGARSGHHELIISADGKSLKGTYTTDGGSGPLEFSRYK